MKRSEFKSLALKFAREGVVGDHIKAHDGIWVIHHRTLMDEFPEIYVKYTSSEGSTVHKAWIYPEERFRYEYF